MIDGADGSPRRRVTGPRVRWTTAMRDTFFAHLAGNCNIRAAAEAIGVAPSQVYYRRKTSEPFAAHWAQAIDAAYHLLETRMLGHVLAGGGEDEVAGDGVADAIDWEKAVKLLAMHTARREDRVRVRKPVDTVATREQSDAAILAKLRALASRNASVAGGAAGQAAEGAAGAAAGPAGGPDAETPA